MLVKTRKKLITFQRTNLLFILIATDNLCLYGILHAIFPYQMFKICYISISNVQNMLYFYIKCSKYDIFPYRNILYFYIKCLKPRFPRIEIDPVSEALHGEVSALLYPSNSTPSQQDLSDKQRKTQKIHLSMHQLFLLQKKPLKTQVPKKTGC